MVVGAFPVAKLFALFLKQISKPIANAAKERAKTHPFFRNYICMPPAQFYNWCEIKAKMYLLNMGKPVNIPVLSESMAIELGANLLGEGIIFIIAAGILISEYTRSARKEAAKEQARIQELIAINDIIRDLFFQVERQDTQIKELTQIVRHLESKIDKNAHKRRPPPGGPDGGSPANLISSSNLSTKELVERTVGSQHDNFLRNSGLITKGLDYLYCNSFLVTSIS